MPIIRTARLQLRDWRDEDRAPFAVLNADPRVTEFLPAPLSREESDALATRIQDGFTEHGFGLWAVEVTGGAPFIGFVGLSVPRFVSHFTPCVEIGWRLDAAHWGQGYATEAANAAAGFAFNLLGHDELVSFTVPANTRSVRIMEKLGMTHNPAEDFDHPLIPDGHPLKPHVLYRLRRD